MSRNKALIVLSGGQDSVTCLALALAASPAFSEVRCLTFNYGQRHARELQAARDIAYLAGITQHEVCDVGPILQGTSPLTDPSQPLEQYQDFESMDKIIGDRVELTFVPMRNALFLTLAANRAAVAGAQVIYTGVCQQDNANYPDCRFSFIEQQEKTINEALGTLSGAIDEGYIELRTPLMFMSKAESVKMMARMDRLHYLAFSHTAYDGQYPPLGRDHATLLRAQGFKEAGIPDPLMVRAWLEGYIMLDDVPGATGTWGPGSANFTALCDAISFMKATLLRRDQERANDHAAAIGGSLEASE